MRTSREQRRPGDRAVARDLRRLVERLDVEEARRRAAEVRADGVGEDDRALNDRVTRRGDDRLALEFGVLGHAVLRQVAGERLLVDDLLALLHPDRAGVGILDRAPDRVAGNLQQSPPARPSRRR